MTQAPGTAGLVVSALWREDLPDTRAAVAERRLLRTVAEWPAGAGVDLMMHSGPKGRVHVEVRPVGPVGYDWEVDVAFALEIVAATEEVWLRPQPVEPARFAELVRDPSRSFARPDDEPRPVLVTAAADVVWPTSVREVAVPPAALLHANPHSCIRTVITSPSDVERMMLRDEALATWDRSVHGDLDAYLGSPVRARTFVGTSARGFASLRAMLRGWGTGLVLRERTVAWHRLGDEHATAGSARPEGWALALLRLPACGDQPARGLESRFRPVAERPLAARIRAGRGAVRLGSALTADGDRTQVRLAPANLLRHVFVEGQSGAGKTTFLTSLVASLSRQGIGFTLLDPHGAGVDAALGALAPGAASGVELVRHGDRTAPGGVNLFDVADDDQREQVVVEFTELVQSIFDPRGEGIVGPRWRRWFTLLCDAVFACWGRSGTLMHLLAIASDPARAAKVARRITSTHPDLAARLMQEVVGLRGDEAANLPAWAVSKLQPLLAQRTMRDIVGQPVDQVDVGATIDAGRSLLVDLGGATLGAPSARILGSLWLLKHWVAMGRRADRARPHVLIVDEAHLFSFGALPAMLAEARKFGIGVVLASQTIESLPASLQAQIEANVGSHVSFRLGLQTAPRASARLGGWPVRELTRLPDLRAAVTLRSGGVQGDPFLLTVTRPRHDAGQAAEFEAAGGVRRSAAAGPVVTDAVVDATLEPPRRSPARPPVPRRRTETSFLDEWVALPGSSGGAATGAADDG